MIFHGIEGVSLQWVLDGIIFSIVFGLAAGNYACSLVFRLPRGRLILDKKPYCGTCSTPLQVKDLFPVISAVLLRHRCRYCGTPFPVSHTWTEVLVGVLYLLAFFRYNFSEEYFLVTLIGLFFITLAAIEANEKMIMNSVLLCALVCGIILRTLQDHMLFNSLQGILVTLVVGCLLRRRDIQQVGHIYVPPKPVLVAAVCGGCVGLHALPVFAVLLIVFYVADKCVRLLIGNRSAPLFSVAAGLAATLLVLYPELSSVYFIEPVPVMELAPIEASSE